MRKYTVSKAKNTNLWYAHQVGFSYIPVMSERGTFGTRTNALHVAADSMGLTYKDYMDARRRNLIKVK